MPYILYTMRFKWIISLFLFAFLIMATVSAHDNPDNITSPIEEEIEGSDLKDIHVTFAEQMWEENLTDIEVELPEDAVGNFSLKINDEVIYNEQITDKSFKVPIRLPAEKSVYVINIYPPHDMKTYKVSAFYNAIDLNITQPLKVMKYPPNCSFLWGFPEEILQHYNAHSFIMFPRSADGYCEIYVDDRFINRTKVTAPFFSLEGYNLQNLNLGDHTLRMVYLGDNYYMPGEKTFKFKVTNAVIDIPKTLNLTHDDCISVRVLDSAKGKVYVYIDSKLVYTEQIKNGDFVLSLIDYLKCDSSEVTVKFEGDFTRSKTQKVNIVYDFDVWGEHFIYGEDNRLEIDMPDNLNTDLLTVLIDGVRYPFTHPEYIMNNLVEVDISKLSAGNHTVFISFSGDERLAAKSKTVNITVSYLIQTPFEVVFGKDSIVYLNLPDDAKGNLAVYLNGKLFTTAKLLNGHAQVNLNSLVPDYYNLTAEYTGSDYEVNPLFDVIAAEPGISITYRLTKGEDEYITVSVPKGCGGYVIINKKRITINDGIARYSLKKLKLGEHDIYIDYYGANGYNSTEYYCVVTVFKPKLRLVSYRLYSDSIHVKVKVLNIKKRPMAGVKISFKFNGKKYSVKTNRKGVAVLKKPLKIKVKKHRLKVAFRGAKLTKTLKARHAIKLNSATVSKSANRLNLQATLKNHVKGKKVTFKFAGKTFKAVTDRKGVAKITVGGNVLNGLNVGGKVSYQASYNGDTVKKSAVVVQ